eukprot:CAMPEP_0198728834 /NCGR_PEP_ID=MMETSP1475-20131203/11863_1 /TAXON_ID= ORGANISM="Unidentified sp., Strain CCMP1999" /NCGR_SAMPLE_ID=MMETSP1475 /ASSEMBLY_ACC=CAM_ASM_001111 /LENGTH=377 /DNA_ID=CAMNT_0044491305 /DNA_START=1 /DNA_END=1131 /DNA_ORIENTATION=-
MPYSSPPGVTEGPSTVRRRVSRRSQFECFARMSFGFGKPPPTRLDVEDWMRKSESYAKSLQVSRPVEIACYSRNADRSVEFGSRSMLSKYRDPPQLADLNAGFDLFVDKPADSSAGVELLVECLQKAEYDVYKADVISFRNNLNKLADTPYNTRDAWEIDACRVKNVVFLEIRKLPERPMDERDKKFMYHGFKFEQFCTQDDTSEPVDSNEEFCSLLKMELGNHQLLISAEVDCVDSRSPAEGVASNDMYIELKVSRMPNRPRQWDNLKQNKFRKYWIQSHLAGVPIIKLGLRDDSGILRRVDSLRTRDLPSLASADMPRSWDQYVILNFLSQSLTFIRSACRDDGTTFRFAYNPFEKAISVREVPEDDLAQRVRKQ